MMDVLIPVAHITVYMASFAALDRALTVLGFQRPYYAVHVLHNLAVTAVTWPDILATFTQFHVPAILSQPVSWQAVYMVFALHFYHTALYWRAFHFDDWLHHGLMIGVALPLGSLVPAGPLMGFSLFFTTGLPGAIGYGALWLERNGWLSRLREKQISQTVNVWIRAPGCVAHGALTLAAALSSVGGGWLWWVGILEAILTAWNGLYFMEQVVVSATKANIGGGAPAGVNNRGREGDSTNPTLYPIPNQVTHG